MGAVITDYAAKMKISHVFGDNVFPKFAILNSVFTYTLPEYQMVAGFYDIMNLSQNSIFSGTDDKPLTHEDVVQILRDSL